MDEGAVLPVDVEQLHALVLDRDAVIEERNLAIEERDLEIQQLREYVRLLKSQQFGASSERVHVDQLRLFNEAEELARREAAEEAAVVSVPAHTRTKRGRRPLPAWSGRRKS